MLVGFLSHDFIMGFSFAIVLAVIIAAIMGYARQRHERADAEVKDMAQKMFNLLKERTLNGRSAPEGWNPEGLKKDVWTQTLIWPAATYCYRAVLGLIRMPDGQLRASVTIWRVQNDVEDAQQDPPWFAYDSWQLAEILERLLDPLPDKTSEDAASEFG